MKKLSILFILMAIACYVNAQEAKKINKKSYSFTYPGGWEELKGSTEKNCSVIAPGDVIGDTFAENINVVIESAKGSALTPQKYADYSKTTLPKKIKKIKFLESKKVTQNGIEGWEMVFKGLQRGKAMQWKQYYFIKNGKIYIMTFTAEESKYTQYMDKVASTLASFKVN